MQNIKKYLASLYKLERIGMKYDLNNIRILLSKLGNPHFNTKYIHIAGTNGKGATASLLSSILMEHGLKTGLYTSPHILKFNERIQINGKFILNSYIKQFIDEIRPTIKKIKPSFFEVTTAVALKYFSEKKVDIAVIETGLGGRLDSTNIIKPELTIITQIGMDHTQYLGNNINSIAKEKLGIVKKGVPVIVSDNNKKLRKLINMKLKNNKTYYVDKIIKTRLISENTNNTKFHVKFLHNERIPISNNFSIPLNGIHQIRNSCTSVLAAYLYLKQINQDFSLTYTKIGLKNVVKNSFYHCRFELVKHNGHNYIFDISHNPDALKEVTNNNYIEKVDTIVFALMQDKDYKTSLNVLNKLNINIIFTKPSYQRAREPKDLFDYMSELKRGNNTIRCINNLRNALTMAQKMNQKNKNILILGSFFLISEAIKILKIQNYFRK